MAASRKRIPCGNEGSYLRTPIVVLSNMRVQLRHAILGLLDLQPQSGYDLQRAFDRSVRHFWHADQSQIYRTLDRMEADGAVRTTTVVQRGKPDRRVHELTDAGRTELLAWLTGPLDEEKAKEPFLARLFFAAELGLDGVHELLDVRERMAEGLSASFRIMEPPEGGFAGALRAATLRAGIAHAEAERTWIAETRKRLKEMG